MKHFRGFLFKEINIVFCSRNLVLIIIMAVICLLLCSRGISAFLQIQQNAKKFQECEKLNFNMLMTYAQYSYRGERIMFMPGPMSVFFENSGAFNNLSARINPVVTIDIKTDYKEKTPGLINNFIKLDVAGMIHLLASIFSLLLGFELTNNKEYLKFLSTLCPPIKVFFYRVFFRLMLIWITLLLIFFAMVLLVYSRGIIFSGSDFAALAAFIAAGFIMTANYFMAGTLLGITMKKGAGIITLITTWVIMALLLPGIINAILQNSKQQPEKFLLESNKLKIPGQFEKYAKKKFGDFDKNNIEIERKITEDYYNTWSLRILKYENNFKDDLEAQNRSLKIYYDLTPTTFYLMTAGSISTAGFNNYLEFYAYIIKMQRRFVRFYIDRCFYNDPKQMVSFIKGDENLFKAGSKIPGQYHRGMLINACLFLVLLLLTWLRFKVLVMGKNRTAIINGDMKKLQTGPGQGKVFLFKNIKFPARVFEYFYHLHRAVKVSFYYICPANHFPGDIKAKDFIDFICRVRGFSRPQKAAIYQALPPGALKSKTLGSLPEMQRGEILLAIMRSLKQENRLFLVNNILKGLPFEFTIKFKDIMEEIEKSGSSVVYLTTEPVTTDTRFQSDQDYEEIPGWKKTVELIKNTATFLSLHG